MSQHDTHDSAGHDSTGKELAVTDDPRYPVPNPGLEEHLPRLTDVDEKAGKRAERQVATMFGLVPLLAIAFVVIYFAVPKDLAIDFGPLHANALHTLLGLTLGAAILLIGIGAVQWARQLMGDVEISEDRHPAASSEEARAATLAEFDKGVAESGITRRKVLGRSLAGALGVLGLPALVMLADLGPWPTKKVRAQTIEHTIWKEGIRLVNDITYTPIKAEDLRIGQLVNAQPENLQDLEGVEFVQEKAKASIIIVRMNPQTIKIPDSRKDWHVGGILCYSKICTHVGCPISLWEQQTHHLLCPCHQSTFDLGDAGVVVFGPAARSLPQLPITTDADGYLVARSGFTVPVGPSYFERDSRQDFKQGDN
ncbi:Rieske 2Fe-2S domain-containing protein [Microlunatus panaciterrae]|uniref:Cytochrome bc1 complex Rieske iron-sulfur subunit n=1 Tax=Microlunatus panaciterrae TaxID=400768 RepID=A0ABS2RMC6_9ACTN|nr:Rieske 2Fe-2S domain-containing protein [Microlunatus panaciterrae]MBM7800132.1 ubiquinol-cytochrome c reductase iron-sulfur subunit [Microlunatus panaciterrae]